MLIIVVLRVAMLNVTYKTLYAECHYAECHYAECRPVGTGKNFFNEKRTSLINVF
jgi:hypothetical protein